MLPVTFSGLGLPLLIQGSLLEALGLAESEFLGNQCSDEQKQVVWLLLQKPLKLAEKFSGKDQTDQ